MFSVFYRSATAAFVGLMLSAQTMAQAAPAESPIPLDELRNFSSVFEHIRRGYVEEISDKDLLEYAIRGMVSELDPHSTFLDEEEYREIKANTQGQFGGVGLEVSTEHGSIKVITPIDDSPSAKAGVQAGDVLIRIDDVSIKTLDFNEALKSLRGPKGSSVKLTFLREGSDQPFEVTLERDIIKVVSVRTRLFEDSYFYIRISQFQNGTGTELAQKLRLQLEKNPNLEGIILDLRNNPGGLVQAAVEVADTFLDGGRVVFTRGRLPSSNSTYNAAHGDITQGLPLVVLINEGSASASEIVAGALQDHARAVILGTKSFGKGTVQSVIPVGAASAIKLTTALYYTPNGRSIQAEGITPDVVIERTKSLELESSEKETEADLPNHLQNQSANSKTSEKKSRRPTHAELLKEDNQLNEALNLLKGLTIYRQQLQKLSDKSSPGKSVISETIDAQALSHE